MATYDKKPLIPPGSRPSLEDFKDKSPRDGVFNGNRSSNGATVTPRVPVPTVTTSGTKPKK